MWYWQVDLVGGGAVASTSSFQTWTSRSEMHTRQRTGRLPFYIKFTATNAALFKSCETSWVEEQVVEAISLILVASFIYSKMT